MTSNEQTLAKFQTRARQMLLAYQQLRDENEELYAMVDKGERERDELRQKLEEKTREYEALKAARLIGVAEGDIDATKDRLAKLIRDVNKCITLLADQKEE